MSALLYLIPPEKSNNCCFFCINGHIFSNSRLFVQPAAYDGISNASRGMDMTESFEEMKARYLKQMQQMREKADGQATDRQVNSQENHPADYQSVSADQPAQSTAAAPPADIPSLPSAAEKQQQTENTEAVPVAVPVMEEVSAGQWQGEPEDTGEGFITVWVVTAGEALPVEGATVVISRIVDGEQMLQGIGTTDISGRTRSFALPAPSATMSQSPDNPTPFARYNISVSADGFAHARYTNVPVFDGIQSVQRVDLVPVTGDGNEDTTIDEQSSALSQLLPQQPDEEEGGVG